MLYLLGPELVSIPLFQYDWFAFFLKYTYNCILAVMVLIACFLSLVLVAPLQFLATITLEPHVHHRLVGSLL